MFGTGPFVSDWLPWKLTPGPELPEIRFRSPLSAPPIVLELPRPKIPPSLLAMACVPARSVPILLPMTRLPLAAIPLKKIP